MKRRRFIQTLAVTPAVALPVAAEIPAPLTAEQGRSSDDASKLEIAAPDVGASTVTRFFTATQLGTLRKLSDLLMPALNGLPGALEAEAPEFLDFLIGKSPAERQQIYRAGLDGLNAQALKQYKKPFSELDEATASKLLAPLREPWTYEPPADPLARFLREAKQDVRTATLNSRAYITAASTGGRRAGGMGQYWYPID